MAEKRVFPPEWYAAQAARRKQRAEAKSQGSSAKEVGSSKSSAPKSSKKKANSNIRHIRGADALMEHRVAKDVLGGVKSFKSYEHSKSDGHYSSTTFYAKKDGGLAASSTRRYGQKSRYGDLVHTKVRKTVSPELYKRYLRMRQRAVKNATKDSIYSSYDKNTTDYRKSSRG